MTHVEYRLKCYFSLFYINYYCNLFSNLALQFVVHPPYFVITICSVPFFFDIHLYGIVEKGLVRLLPLTEQQLPIQEVVASNLGPETGYPCRGASWEFQSLPVVTGVIPQVRPRLFPSTSFSFHCSVEKYCLLECNAV